MKITVLTLFPNMINGFLQESIVKRAQEKGLVEIEVVDLKKFSQSSYGSIDDKPYGGGAGMVMMVEPIVNALKNSKLQIPNSKQTTPLRSSASSELRRGRQDKIILTSARGEVYSQQIAEEYSHLDHLVIIAGHYEGVDERITQYIDEEISVGDFVMTGGEIPAAAIIDSVVRLIPGVLKKEEATADESFGEVLVSDLIKAVGQTDIIKNLQQKGIEKVRLLEYPHYSRPQEFDGKQVPEVITGGNHADIRAWRLQQSYNLTCAKRPDLFEKTGL